MNETTSFVPLASSLSRVIPSRIRELADVAFTMEGVLRLHFGESNLPTPDFIKEAAVRAMKEGYTFYTENAGLPGLRHRCGALTSCYWPPRRPTTHENHRRPGWLPAAGSCCSALATSPGARTQGAASLPDAPAGWEHRCPTS